MRDPLQTLTDAGVSIWLDDLSRERLVSGALAELVTHGHVRGGTTNPSIFATAVSGGGEDYAGQLQDLAARGVGIGHAMQELTTFDVRAACDVLRPVYDATDGVDGRVSIEVDPRLAHDTQATIAEARALWWAPLWGSTSTKDPAYPDTRYVVDLVAPGVVNSMPEATLRAVADHGVVPADSVHAHYAEARDVLDRLAAVGVDYDDVVATLEDEGVTKFDAAWAHLADQLTGTLEPTT